MAVQSRLILLSASIMCQMCASPPVHDTGDASGSPDAAPLEIDGGGADDDVAGDICSAIPGSGSGKWVATGPMVDALRQSETATLLEDGDLLVVGGGPGLTQYHMDDAGYGDARRSVERYSPVTNMWRLAAPLQTPRTEHTATRLLDGRVLVAGGMGPPLCDNGCGNVTLDSVELYDPIADIWSVAPSMHHPRDQPAAVLLRDGRVLVTGGSGDASVEIFDPVSNAWSPAAPTIYAFLWDIAALRLDDGSVLVAGHINDGRQFSLDMESYDPNSGRWHELGMSSIASGALVLLPLPGGRLMVDLRDDWDGMTLKWTTFVDFYDLRSGAWTYSTLPEPNFGGSGIASLSPGRILIAGGKFDYSRYYLNTSRAYLYDDIVGGWVHAANLPWPQRSLVLAPLGDGTAIAISGWTGCPGDGTVYFGMPDVRFIPDH